MKNTIPEQARELLNKFIKTVIPLEMDISNDGQLDPSVEAFYLTVLNSVHTKEQAKRSLLVSLDMQILQAEAYEDCLEAVPIEALTNHPLVDIDYDQWYGKWSDKYIDLCKLRSVVQAFEF